MKLMKNEFYVLSEADTKSLLKKKIWSSVVVLNSVLKLLKLRSGMWTGLWEMDCSTAHLDPD